MTRRKVITYEQILDAACDIVKTYGFGKLTARSVADKIQCSTQPIYLEFHNMEELKQAVFERLKSYLYEWLHKSGEIYSEDPVISICLSYIDFSINNTNIFRSLSTEKISGNHPYKTFIYQTFDKQMSENECYNTLTTTDKQRVISTVWQLATGIASTIINGLTSFDKEKIEQVLKQQIQWVIDDKDYPVLM